MDYLYIDKIRNHLSRSGGVAHQLLNANSIKIWNPLGSRENQNRFPQG